MENDRLTLCCDRYTSNRRFARPFRLQCPTPHPQRAQRTPLKTSPERPVNQPYFATIWFRAVIRPIRWHYQQGELKVVIEDAAADPVQYVRLVEELPVLADVRVEQARGRNRVELTMQVAR